MTDEDGRIDDELRAAGAEWRSTRPTPEGALNPATFTSAPARTGGRPRAIASLAGVGALLAVAVLVVVSLPSHDQHVASSSSSPSASPTVSGTSPTPVIGASDWQRVTVPGIGNIQTIKALDGKLVAAVAHCEPTGTSCDSTMIESTDGTSWTVVASIGADQEPDGPVQILSEDGFGYFAVGKRQGPGAAIWHSSDGQTWDSLGSDPVFDANNCGAAGYESTTIDNLYVAAGKLVALGRVACSTGSTFVAWTSDDGRTWLRTTATPMTDVVTRDGVYVGVQEVSPVDDTVWSSPDGLTWNQIDLPTGQWTVATVSTGFVAFGNLVAGGAETITSSDGVSWAEAEASAPPAFAVVSSDGQRAAYVDRLANPPDGSLWISSPNGLQRTQYQILDSLQFGGLGGATILGDRVVAWAATSPVVWVANVPASVVAPSPNPTPSLSSNVVPSQSPPDRETIVVDGITWDRLQGQAQPATGFDYIWEGKGRFLALSSRCADPTQDDCTYSEYFLLESLDGENWTTLGTIAQDPVSVLTIYDGEDGFLAGGWLEGLHAGAGLWSSTDGLDWTWLGGQDAFLADSCAADVTAGAEIDSLFKSPSGMVALGEDDCGSAPAGWSSWISTTGSDWTRIQALPVLSVVSTTGAYVGSAANGDLQTSTDGLSWHDSYDPKGSMDVAAVASGFVAISHSGRGTSAHSLLTSPDGSTWTEWPNPFGSLWLSDLTSDGTRAIALEDSDSNDTSAPGAIWVSSPDGATWSRYQLPPRDNDYASTVAILGNRVLASGVDYNGLAALNTSVIWVADIP